MKNIIFLTFFLIFANADVYAQYTFIPDPVFEQILIDQNIDSDNTINGQVITSDINTVLSLEITTDNISNLSGIQSFTAIENLKITSNINNINSIDLSQNLNLKIFHLINSTITSINLSNNIQLQDLLIANQYLNNLNLTSNVNLKNLLLYGCSINSINLNNNLLLETLYLEQLNLFNLNFASNTNLRSLYLNTLGNPFFGSSLNLTSNINLNRIIIGNTSLNNIILSNNLVLEELQLVSVNITAISLINNNLLHTIVLKGNSLSSINISDKPFLKRFDCSANNRFNANTLSLNFNNNPLLEYMQCKNSSVVNLTIKNGNNNLLNGTGTTTTGFLYDRFDARNNPNLNCIYVDNISNCNANWLKKDSNANYVSTQAECDNLLLNEKFSKYNVSIYPNPTSDFIYIQSNDEQNEILNYKIIDNTGRIIKSNTTNYNQKISLEELNSGNYILQIETNENEKIIKKLIKK